MPRNVLWTDGLICAFEFIRGHKKSISSRMMHMPALHAASSSPRLDGNKLLESSSFNDLRSNEISSFDDNKYSQFHGLERHDGSHLVPIGWARISKLVQNLQMDANLTLHHFESMDDEADLTIADLAAPYWEHLAGPIWWCHVYAGHPSIQAWLSSAQWLHPTVSLALKDESRMISERMRHLLYEVPVRVAGGLLFELSGQSVGDPLVGDPFVDENDIPLYSGSHARSSSTIRGSVFYTPVIRVKWPLHAREEIVFELLQHLRGYAARNLLKEIRKSTREMIEEQEAVCGRLFTIQDVLQSTVRAWLQDKSLRVTHNLVVFGGCGLVLSTITGLFGINVDLIPGAKNTPYAFGLFAATLVFLGVLLIVVGIIFLGLKKPGGEKQVEVRTFELQELVKMFQLEAETHGQVRKKHFSEKHAPNCW
ncbi:Mg2+ transporter protein, Zinc transport protein [Fagus crenata]